MKNYRWVPFFYIFFVCINSAASPISISETDRSFYVQGGDSFGRLVGYVGNAGAALYDGGVIREVPIDQALSINDFGVIAGVKNDLPAVSLSGVVVNLDFPVDPLPDDSPRDVVGPLRFNYSQKYSGVASAVTNEGLVSGVVIRRLDYTESCYYPDNPGAACGGGWHVSQTSFKIYVWDVSGLPGDAPVLVGEKSSWTNYPGYQGSIYPYISGDLDGYLSQADVDAGWRTSALSYISPSGVGYGSVYNNLNKANGIFAIPISAIPEPGSFAFALAGVVLLIFVAKFPVVCSFFGVRQMKCACGPVVGYLGSGFVR